MKLAEIYALQCGLLIDKPYINKKFYPLPSDYSKVILVHAGGGNNKFPSKIYDYFDEVISIMKPITDKYGYVFYQIGGKSETNLNEAISLCGQTTLQQTAYLLSNASLFIGNDSMNAHIRASEGLPSITVFGPTSAREHGPYWKTDKNICIESHKRGRKHTFASSEGPKTINFIAPETIANKALELLNIPERINNKTLFIGDSYQQLIVELIPDHVPNPRFLKDLILTLRLDYLHNETLIEQIAANRKITIITKQQINLTIIKNCKSSIAAIVQEVDFDTDVKYVEALKRTGIKTAFYTRTRDDKRLADLRYKFFDYTVVEQFFEKTKEEFFNGASEFLNTELDKNLKMEETYFKSNKFLLSNGKIYLSSAHYFAEQPTESFDQNSGLVIDNDMFWLEQDNMLIYNK